MRLRARRRGRRGRRNPFFFSVSPLFLSAFSSLHLECVLFALPLGPRINFLFLFVFSRFLQEKVGEQYTLAFELETAKMGFSTRMKISARTFFQPFIDPKNTFRQGKEGQFRKDRNRKKRLVQTIYEASGKILNLHFHFYFLSCLLRKRKVSRKRESKKAQEKRNPSTM